MSNYITNGDATGLYVQVPPTQSDKISIRDEWVFDWNGSGFGWTWFKTTIEPVDTPQTKPDTQATPLNSLADS
jgi:hypothetical protein